MRASVSLLLCGLCCSTFLWAGDSKPSPPSFPSVSIRDSLTPRQALREVRKQTGITVADTLAEKAAFPYDLRQVTFWQAVDSVARAAKGKVVQSSRDGSVTVQPIGQGERTSPSSFDGPFRVRVSRLTCSRELDSDRSACVVSLDVSWLPTLRPLFLEGFVQKPRLVDSNGKQIEVGDEGSSLIPVDGRFSLPVELTLPGPPRRELTIGSLSGKLLAIAPSKMLRFAFDNDLASQSEADLGGAQRRKVMDQVTCEVGKIVLGRESWSVSVHLDYPEGNYKLESFQAGSLVANNECVLTGKDAKQILRASNYSIDQVGSRRARVTYHFNDRPGAPRRGKASDWRLAYTAPASIVEVPFSFSFSDLPLP